MLNKKELKSCESPEPEQNGYDQMQNKFPKISNSDFDQLLKNQSMQESAANMVRSTSVKKRYFTNLSDLCPLRHEPPYDNEQLPDQRSVAHSCKSLN